MPLFFELAPHKRVFAGFFIYSMALGGLYPRLGDIQLTLGIGEAALGASLIGIALGTQVSLTLGGRLIERIGYRMALLTGLPVIGLFMAVAAFAPSAPLLFAALVLAGLAIGVVEIVLNVEADRTEHLIGRRVMNRAHAFWSLGFFAAGIVGAVARQFGVSPVLHLGVMALVALVAALLVLSAFSPAPAREASIGAGPRFVRPSGPILVLVAFTLSAMLLEGAAADWSVIFMRDVFATPPFVSGLAFALGALAQAVARYFADALVERHGAPTLARGLVLTLGAGAILVAFAPNPAAALFGFILMGVGTSAMFPLAMSAAARRTDRSAGTNVAALAQLSFITFLVAPPLLGIIAETFGIRLAFGIGLPLVVLSWFTLHALDPVAGKRRPSEATHG